MNNFKKGDRVVYTGERQKMLGRGLVNVGAKGIVVAINGLYVVVNWNNTGCRPPMQCYHNNLSLCEPENEINKALAVLKKHGTVEFTPTPPPWEGTIYICTRGHFDADDGLTWYKDQVRSTSPGDSYEGFWRKLKAKEVRK